MERNIYQHVSTYNMCHDYIGKVWNKSENLYRSYNVLSANIYFTDTETTEDLKQSFVHYINKP